MIPVHLCINEASILRENMREYLLADIINFEKPTEDGFEEQMMSKEKYPCIFLRKMEAIVFVILQNFFATPVVLKIREYHRIAGEYLTIF